MKRKPTRAGRRIIQQTADWLASSDRRFAETGRYCTDQEVTQARRGLARLNRARQHAH